MDGQARQEMKEQLEREDEWARRLYECFRTCYECFRTCDDLRVGMRRDPKEFEESLSLADAAVKMLWRRVCQQRDRCVAIKRQLEETGGGE
jgi:hypothetical protein